MPDIMEAAGEILAAFLCSFWAKHLVYNDDFTAEKLGYPSCGNVKLFDRKYLHSYVLSIIL